MNAEVIIFMDTECSGRFYDVRTSCVHAFQNMYELQLLCQIARFDDICLQNSMLLPNYNRKGKLTTLHISICAVDQNGVHGFLRVSPSEHVVFKSSDDLEQLISRRTARALKRQRKKTAVQRSIALQDGAGTPPYPQQCL